MTPTSFQQYQCFGLRDITNFYLIQVNSWLHWDFVVPMRCFHGLRVCVEITVSRRNASPINQATTLPGDGRAHPLTTRGNKDGHSRLGKVLVECAALAGPKQGYNFCSEKVCLKVDTPNPHAHLENSIAQSRMKKPSAECGGLFLLQDFSRFLVQVST